MNNFNFLPEKFKKKLKNEINIRLFYAMIFSVLIWGIVFGITIFATLQFLNIQNKALEDSISSISNLKETTEAKNLETEISEFNKILLRFKDIKHSNPYNAVDIIERVANAVPVGIVLKNLNFHSNTGTIFISGHADLRTQVSVLENRLREDELFKKVDSPLSNLFKSENVDFQFTISLNNE